MVNWQTCCYIRQIYVLFAGFFDSGIGDSETHTLAKTHDNLQTIWKEALRILPRL